MGIFLHTKISANWISFALKTTNMILPYKYKRRTDNCQFHPITISIQLYIIKKAFKKLTLKLRTIDVIIIMTNIYWALSIVNSSSEVIDVSTHLILNYSKWLIYVNLFNPNNHPI